MEKNQITFTFETIGVAVSNLGSLLTGRAAEYRIFSDVLLRNRHATSTVTVYLTSAGFDYDVTDPTSEDGVTLESGEEMYLPYLDANFAYVSGAGAANTLEMTATAEGK